MAHLSTSTYIDSVRSLSWTINSCAPVLRRMWICGHLGCWFPELWRPKRDSIHAVIPQFPQSLVVQKKSKPFLSTWYFPLWSLTSGFSNMFPYFTHRQWSSNPDLQDTKPICIAFALGKKATTGQLVMALWEEDGRCRKRQMINRAGQRSAVRTLLDCLKNYKEPKGGKHPRTRSLASDNICREHDASSTPCRWSSLKKNRVAREALQNVSRLSTGYREDRCVPSSFQDRLEV